MSMLFLKYQYAYFLFEKKRFSRLFENEVSINVLFSYIYINFRFLFYISSMKFDYTLNKVQQYIMQKMKKKYRKPTSLKMHCLIDVHKS